MKIQSVVNKGSTIKLQLILLLAGAAILLYVLSELLPAKALITIIPTSLITLIFGFALSKSSRISLSFVLMISAIPIGLLFSCMHFSMMIVADADPEAVSIAYASALTVAFFGGLISALSYFANGGNETSAYKPITLNAAILITLCFLFSVFLYFELLLGLEFLFDKLPFLLAISLSFLGASFAMWRGDSVPATGPIIATSIAVLGGTMATILWILVSLGNDPRSEAGYALGLGLWTMLYGFVLYCCTIVISFTSTDVKLQSFTSQNWHLVEVYTFFVFLVLGPPTLMELFANG